ncbi:MAG: hypothetical protein RL271_828 [Actinomycetota bacterium]
MSNQIQSKITLELTGRDRVSVLFRLILVAPIAIFSSSFSISDATNGWPTAFLVLPALLALVFREVYPSYVLNFNKALLGLTTRIVAFVLLLQDGYPSIESDPRVEITFPEIDGGKKLNRFLPLVKWFLAIPLYLVGIVYFPTNIRNGAQKVWSELFPIGTESLDTPSCS